MVYLRWNLKKRTCIVQVNPNVTLCAGILRMKCGNKYVLGHLAFDQHVTVGLCPRHLRVNRLILAPQTYLLRSSQWIPVQVFRFWKESFDCHLSGCGTCECIIQAKRTRSGAIWKWKCVWGDGMTWDNVTSAYQITSGRIATNPAVNVHKALSIGTVTTKHYKSTCPGGFQDALLKKMRTMATTNDHIQVG